MADNCDESIKIVYDKIMKYLHCFNPSNANSFSEYFSVVNAELCVQDGWPVDKAKYEANYRTAKYANSLRSEALLALEEQSIYLLHSDIYAQLRDYIENDLCYLWEIYEEEPIIPRSEVLRFSKAIELLESGEDISLCSIYHRMKSISAVDFARERLYRIVKDADDTMHGKEE